MHSCIDNPRKISSAHLTVHTVLLTDSVMVEYRSNSSRRRTQLLSISFSKQSHPNKRNIQSWDSNAQWRDHPMYSRSISCPPMKQQQQSIKNTLTDIWQELSHNQLQPLNHPKRHV